jgi:hypothetical protein
VLNPMFDLIDSLVLFRFLKAICLATWLTSCKQAKRRCTTIGSWCSTCLVVNPFSMKMEEPTCWLGEYNVY